MDFWVVMLVFFLGVVPVISIVALVFSFQNRRAIRDLQNRMARGDLGRTAPGEPSAAKSAQTLPAVPITKPETKAQAAERRDGGSRWKAKPPKPRPAKPTPTSSKPPAFDAPQAAAIKRAAGTQSFEEKLTSRWLVWLGGLALALGGGFLVKFTIDQGWFGPALRVSSGVLLGIALAGGGEWLRRRPLQQAIAQIRPDFVPGALTAAGVSIAFGSIYAAYALYGLIPPLIAFAALAVIAVAAIAMSLWQGPFVAILGVLGAYWTPLLISTGGTNAIALFPYLLAVTASAVWITRYRGWWWLNCLALIGALGWPLLWTVAVWDPGDMAIVGPYTIAVTALFLMVRHTRGDEDTLSWTDPGMQIAFLAAIAAVPVMFMGTQLDGYDLVSRLSVAGLATLYLGYGFRVQKFDVLAPLAAVLVALFMLGWHTPVFVSASPRTDTAVTPGELLPFLYTCAAFSLTFLAAGYAAIGKARRPVLWAGVSAFTPIVLLATAYWRIEGFETSVSWSLSALALALVFVTAASRQGRIEGRQPALAIFAVATIAALVLGATMLLRDAWLTVAFAVMLPAIAHVEKRVPEAALRRIAEVVAMIVMARLALNPYVLDYTISGVAPGVNWLLYGYGLPALAFWYAARLFRPLSGQGGSDRLVALLEAGGLIFLTLLISMEVRHLMSPDGRLDHWRYELPEMAINTAVWGVTGLVMFWKHLEVDRTVFTWGWMVYAALATGQVIGGHLLLFNPYFTGEKVGFLPIANLLLLLYAVPAAIAAAWFWRAEGKAKWKPVRSFAGMLGLMLAFAWVTLEIRHAFHGTRLDTGNLSDGEWWSYSAGWLVYGVVLLGLGLWRESAALRYASLAVIMLTVAKVFLSDMAALEGLLRALSFLGLGGTLVAIGFFYQRVVFAPAGGAGEGGEGGEAG